MEDGFAGCRIATFVAEFRRVVQMVAMLQQTGNREELGFAEWTKIVVSEGGGSKGKTKVNNSNPLTKTNTKSQLLKIARLRNDKGLFA